VELAALAVFVAVIGAVAIDALARGRRRDPPREQGAITTEKIVIDLSKRR
jgi:hypothetical protein